MGKICKLIFLFLLISGTAIAQQTIKGYIYDAITQEALPGVNVYYKDKSGPQGTFSDSDGFYELAIPAGSINLTFSYLGYEPQNMSLIITRNQSRTMNVYMKIQENLMEEVVVSAGRYEQKLSDITVSMELLKAGDILKQAPTDLTSVLKTVPGVEINDRQPTIRSGSGWTYGVGSRAMIMVDGVSVLTPGSGEINWNVVPMENVEQIEVIKGASSVLYGSSALNGLINVRTKRPSIEPSTTIKAYLGFYGTPSKKRYEWWDNSFWKENKFPVTPLGRRNIFSGIKNPIYDGIDISHSRRIGNLDMTAGINYFTDEGYRAGNYTDRLRIGGNLTYHDPNVQGLDYGFNLNFLSDDYAGFFIWRSPEEVYDQSPLANMGRQSNQFYIDPFVNYTNTEKGITHRIKGRFYRQGNQIVSPNSEKSILDIVDNMGFDYAKVPEMVDLVENWQIRLLPVFLPILSGNYSKAVQEIQKLGNYYFPAAKPADYMDAISWIMPRTPLPSGKEELVPWLANAIKPIEKATPPTDYTTFYNMDYQFSKRYDHSLLTTGLTYERVLVNSKTTGEHKSDNIATFFQYDHKFFDRLNVSAGVRLEYYRVDDSYKEAETKILGAKLPFKPVFRGGLNYELAEYSFVRASFGQGYRYPSVTEKFVLKDIGGVGAFPNSGLKAERGYNAELGFKQGYKLGGLKGFVDVAGFYTRYTDMIEFRIGLFDNQTFEYLTGLGDIIDRIKDGDGIGIGAQFSNVGRAEISGVDFSVTGLYDFSPDSRLTFNLGYVYTEPRDMDLKKRNAEEEASTDPLAMRSKSNDSKYLKYRQKHSVKGMFDYEWKRLSIGTNLAWKSKTLAVDYFFTDEREKTEKNLMDYARYMLFGNLQEYWADKNRGYLTMDLRLGFKLSKHVHLQGMVNNLLNTEYTTRPMDVAPPRTFIMQTSIHF